LLCLVAVVLLAGCKVAAQVDIALRADGSGTITARVTLDADAARRLTRHASLTDAVPLDDVRAAGWKVSGWTTSNGAATITLSHDFVGRADLARRLADLVGPTGVLRDARLTRGRGWVESKDGIAVTGDLRHLSTGIRSDAELSRNLTDAGVDVNAQQRGGFTPLHAAAQHGDVELLELLLSAGADPTVARDDGATPAQTAEAEGHVDVARRLREVEAARAG